MELKLIVLKNNDRNLDNLNGPKIGLIFNAKYIFIFLGYNMTWVQKFTLFFNAKGTYIYIYIYIYFFFLLLL